MEIDDRVTEAMAHVQKAGLELIAAMRNALDVAEDLLGDPQAVTTLMRGAAEAAKVATERVQRIPVDD
ncbi:MAG TPA: hypothetical protein VHD87_10520 [Acidimicrobiales bacterium]|nr:hypothetical protein [Acidimicrobiales bacterium]